MTQPRKLRGRSPCRGVWGDSIPRGRHDQPLIGPAGVPRQVTSRATWLLAPNPGPMTFDGTNSWVLHEPGLWADPRRGDRILGAGPFELNGLRIDVIATPGHSSDSLSFHLPDDEAMVTGDTVLGRSAPAILDPDGQVDQLITSLDQIRLLLDTGVPVILPGHGPVVTDPGAQLALALTAREARLAQHEAAVRDGCRTTGEIADRLYGPFDERIGRAIEATVRAHLRYLRDHRGLDSSVEIDG